MGKISIAWIVSEIDKNDGAFFRRVYIPSKRLNEMGYYSKIFEKRIPQKSVKKFNVVIFHRILNGINTYSSMGKIVGLDLGDDLFKIEQYKKNYDFLLADSLRNTRYYHSPDTFYWPHGFEIKPETDLKSYNGVTKFVFCGYPENVQCLLGDPINAFENVGKKRKISLTIITNTKDKKGDWIGKIPEISAKNFEIIWKEWELENYEENMRECNVGFFPQIIGKERWQRKSIYKVTHAASIGIPSIISPTEEALSTYTNKINTIMPWNAKEWEEAVELMTEYEFRKKIVKNARELCRLRYNMDIIVQQLVGIIRIYYLNEKSKIKKGKFNRKIQYLIALGQKYENALLKRIHFY